MAKKPQEKLNGQHEKLTYHRQNKFQQQQQQQLNYNHIIFVQKHPNI